MILNFTCSAFISSAGVAQQISHDPTPIQCDVGLWESIMGISVDLPLEIPKKEGLAKATIIKKHGLAYVHETNMGNVNHFDTYVYI